MSDSDVVAWYLVAYAYVIIISLLAQILIKRFHLDKIIPQAGATMMINMVISGIIKLCGGFNHVSTSENILEDTEEFDAHLLGLSTSMFYYVLLPPIIFSSGYHLKRQIMFSNFGGILVLAIVGTSLSITIISTGLYYMIGNGNAISLTFMECITFASLISSTDPVSTLSIYAERNVESGLFYLVFGESILNDAVALTVFSVSSNFVGENSLSFWQLMTYVESLLKLLFGSTILGYILGIGIGYVFKHLRLTNSLHDQNFAIALFLPIIFIPFLVSESIGLSGIVAALSGGIAIRRYMNKNVPRETSIKASFVLTLLSHFAETICFAQLGLCVFMQNFQNFHWILVLVTLGFIFLARLPIYPLLALVNLYRHFTTVTTTARVSSRQNPSASSIYNYSEIGLCDGIGTTENRQESNENENDSVQVIISTTDQISDPSVAKPLVSLQTMHMVYWAGLRGAVSYACANIFPDQNGNRNMVVTTTIAVILFTVIVQGGLTDLLLTKLGIPQREKEKEKLILDLSAISGKRVEMVSFMDEFEKKFIYPCIVDPNNIENNIRDQWSPAGRRSNYSSGGGSVYSPNESFADGVVSMNSPPARHINTPKTEPNTLDL